MGLTKATLENVDNPRDVIHVLFNPTEYTMAKSNTWSTKPNVGKNVPKRDFTGGGSKTLNMELFFDVFEEENGDVRPHVDKLWALTMIDEKKVNASTKKGRPPLCLFSWGGDWHFKACITQLSVRYTLFRDDGTPVRATAKITLEEAEDATEQPMTNPTSHTEPGRRRRLVRPQDTLATIAYEEYGDPNMWRKIAQDNHLDDPLALHPGQVLAIPPAD